MKIATAFFQKIGFNQPQNKALSKTLPLKKDSFECSQKTKSKNNFSAEEMDTLTNLAQRLKESRITKTKFVRQYHDSLLDSTNHILHGLIVTQDTYKFPDINQLMVFSILEETQALDEEVIMDFVEDKEKTKTFLNISNFDKKDQKISPTKTMIIYELIKKADGNKEKLKQLTSAYNQIGHLPNFIDIVKDDEYFERYLTLTTADKKGKPKSGLNRTLTPEEAYSSLFPFQYKEFEPLSNEQIQSFFNLIKEMPNKNLRYA